MSYELEPNLNYQIEANAYIDNPEKAIGTIVTPGLTKFYANHDDYSWSLIELQKGLRGEIDQGLITGLKKKTGRFIHNNISSKLDPTLNISKSPPLLHNIDVSKLRVEDIAALRATTLVESGNPVFSSVLMNYFRRDHKNTGFLAMWTEEEWKHYQGSLMYLEAAARLAPEKFEAAKNPQSTITPPSILKMLEQDARIARDGEWGKISSKYPPILANFYPTIQELLTYLTYNRWSQNVKEPVLQWLLQRMAGDEMRHCVEYSNNTKLLLTDPKDPKKQIPEYIAEIDHMMLTFLMPGDSFVPNYEIHGKSILQVANPGKREIHQVINKMESLVGKQHVAELLCNDSYRKSLEAHWHTGSIDPKIITAYRVYSKLSTS